MDAIANKVLTVVQVHAQTIFVIQIVLEMDHIFKVVTAQQIKNAHLATVLQLTLANLAVLKLSQLALHILLVATVRKTMTVAHNIVKHQLTLANHPVLSQKLLHILLTAIVKELISVVLECAQTTCVYQLVTMELLT